MSNADRRPQQLCWTVGLLINLRDLDTAAEYARLAYSKIYCHDTLSTCDIIIGAMCEAKRYRDALDLYHHFFNESSKVMSATCRSSNHIIRALCDLGRVDDALALLSAVSPNGINYGNVTKVLVHAGRFEEALCLLRKHPVPLACTNLIRGFLNLGNLDMANQLLEEFESKGFHADRPWEYKSESGVVRVAFIEHWFKQGKHEEAMRCYQSLLGNDRYQVFGDTGHALLQLLLSYGKKTEAWDLFHRMLDVHSETIDVMVRERFKVNSETIDMMVGECFKEGRFKEGIETFYKVKAKDKYLNLLDHRNVILRCCEHGMLPEAECFFAELSSDRSLSAIDVDTHRAMMDAYVKAGRVEDALQTANNMVDAYLSSLALWMQI
ncbi:unnamed protein product [Arabis nemorensis]|uniref:Pentacotripeptide-repeat region of PRORP domain-containing protein n=1 Tax=Arabis nemorensis TaxID=586526 RepID=A0A565AVT6_9BRAS|nr:unnamed protein product [Arabis nemorensis]